MSCKMFYILSQVVRKINKGGNGAKKVSRLILSGILCSDGFLMDSLYPKNRTARAVFSTTLKLINIKSLIASRYGLSVVIIISSLL